MQVTPSIVGKYDATQFAVSSGVEATISRKPKQAGHIPPADLLLQVSNIRQSMSCQLAVNRAP